MNARSQVCRALGVVRNIEDSYAKILTRDVFHGCHLAGLDSFSLCSCPLFKEDEVSLFREQRISPCITIADLLHEVS